nr:integrase, catalytic region, zinc finger, CCHC-type, peptidase aspartic, catalytic [Tanacetum cinerariifolium]
DAGYLQTQLLITQKEEAGIQLQAKEYDLMAAVADLDEIEEEKSTVSFLLEEKKKLKSDFKTFEDKLLDKQIQLEKRIKELNNIMLKTGQSIQTIHMLSPKPNLFYHTEQKMALGYQNFFYLKQAQKKQESLYDRKVLLEKHDPPVVHGSEETLQLAQESRDKMKQMNKELKPANYTKINHLSWVFVPQKALSREESYFSNNSKTANVSKSFLIPNEDLSDDTTPSVARKFLTEVKITILTLQRVVKQRMTIETHNWTSSAHQELHKIKADDSLAKHKALELEIEYLQTELERTKERFENCIIKKEIEYAKLWNDWYKKCDKCKYDKISYDKAYKDMQQKIKRLQAQLGDLEGKSKDTSSVSDTRNPLSQKLKNKNVELEFQFMGTVRFENDHVAAILGFCDLQWGNIFITKVYFVEGLGHNLFSIGQFYDSDLEVAFR